MGRINGKRFLLFFYSLYSCYKVDLVLVVIFGVLFVWMRYSNVWFGRYMYMCIYLYLYYGE